MKIGYARVSTDDQNLALQLDALRAAGCDPEYIKSDKESGAKASRPGLDACLAFARPGDTVVVWRLDRLGRSLSDLVRIVGDLEHKGIGFESLTEKIDTTSATGKLVFHLFAALAEFERNLTRERTNAGLSAARARGRTGGRKPLSDDKITALRQLFADQKNTPEMICKTLGISRATLYRYAKEGGNA